MLSDLFLVLVLAVGAWLRFTGVNWDENQHMHPDERFLTMVETSIQLPGLGEYFNTDESPLNPNNVGHSFFVYGTLPVFLVRVVAEWTNNAGYDQVTVVGRLTSAGFDVLSILLVCLIGRKLYQTRVGLLAAALYAFCVLPIQHAHFFVVESFTNAFILLGFLFAARVLDEGRWADYILFGVALGMALASKISAFPLAGILVLVGLVRIWQVPAGQRLHTFQEVLVRLSVAGLASALSFRIFQPYAFAGPSFFGILPNPRWIANLRELWTQAGGTVDFPPALQWADRTPVVFALKNLVLWGMGAPLGVVAWLGWGWAVLRMVGGEWRRHFLLVIWSGGYFLWQSTGFTPAMRYQLPVYPTLILLGSWGLWELWGWAGSPGQPVKRIARAAVGALGCLVLAGTAIWGLAFTSIYNRPMTRVAASRWIYSHVPGVVNLVVESDDGERLEPIPMPLDFMLQAGVPHLASFAAQVDGEAISIVLPFVRDLSPGQGPRRLSIRLQESPDPESAGIGAAFEGSLPADSETRLEIPFDVRWDVLQGRTYYLVMELEDAGAIAISGNLAITYSTPTGEQEQSVGLPEGWLNLVAGGSETVNFVAHSDGLVQRVLLPNVGGWESVPTESTIRLTVFEAQDSGPRDLGTAQVTDGASAVAQARWEFAFDQPVVVVSGGAYGLRLELVSGTALSLRGSVIVSESSWDDGLPLRIDGRDMGGVYTGVVQELYWPDDQDDDHDQVPDKLERIEDTLSQGDYLIITSNRQYGTIPRVPSRYPLTTAYYQALFRCPQTESVLDCGATAQVDGTPSPLGYELVAVFESHPSLGPLVVNDQLAEEAFTVYDHPKVLIFVRSPTYSRQAVKGLLGEVDLSNVVHTVPGEVGSAPPDLMLPPDRLAEQQAGGTWSELFDRSSPINRSEPLAVLVWWLAIGAIGLAAVPLTRAALPGLADGGYPLARVVGLLIVAWGSWLLGSLRVPFGRGSILAVFLAMTAVSTVLVVARREDWSRFVREHRREILWTEVLALLFFALDLWIRLGNPDLWHPAKGGEKPMDLSYLNAILRSTSFPPYDPWFAGGYINYYYYGFVIVGVPIRLLGLNPTVAYNLAIPTLFAMLALAAYSVGYNLVRRCGAAGEEARASWPRLAGTACAVALVLLGNLGTVRLLYEGFKRIGAPPGEEPATFVVGGVQAISGAARYLTLQSSLPYALDSWYWNPSRAIPPEGGEAGPITEFPFFTFLYADLHAHMVSRPIAVLALGCFLSWVLAAERQRRLSRVQLALVGFVGALTLGAIRPTNLGDYPVYWGLGAIAAAAGVWLRRPKLDLRTLADALGAAAALIGLSYLLYYPYHHWYAQGYGSVRLWDGSRTPLSAYFVVHGLFLFVMIAWMVWETGQWMAATPLSALARWRPRAGVLMTVGAMAVLLVAGLVVAGYPVALIAIPVCLWAAALFLRPGQPAEKRFALTLLAAGVALTLLVEIVVTVGDISRMNTVFKFYLQVWELFCVASAGALVWTAQALPAWRPGWRRFWAGALAALVVGAALYPLTAAVAKIRDRWSSSAPHVLDGMAFMPYVTYFDLGESIRLEEDQAAIRWLQDEVEGSPVIVEANIPEYRWGSRMTVYTGLPGVLGWNWHQRQQRVLAGDPVVWSRANAITSFYLTTDLDEALAFLETYHVRYVVVGRLERMYYESFSPCLPSPDGDGVLCDMSGRPPLDGCYGACPVDIAPQSCSPPVDSSDPLPLNCPTGGLDKFERMANLGMLRVAFRQGETAIYEVVP